MATRGRIKGWKSPAAVAAMSPEEREAYEAMMAKAKAEREAEKKQSLIAKGIDPETHEKEKAEKEVKKQEKQINLQNLINSQLEYQRTHIMSQDEDEEEKNGKPWYQEDNSISDHRETIINHISGEGFCLIETNEAFWINKIAEMIEKTPDKIIVLSQFSNEDMIRVKIPYSCMKKIKTSQRVVSEEQRKRMSELGKVMGKKRGRPRKNPIDETELENKSQEESKNDTTRLAKNMSEIIEKAKEEEDDLGPETTVVIGVNETDEETDEEFETTPMNKYRDYSMEDDIAYATSSPMAFGNDVSNIREHRLRNHDEPLVLNCDTADQDDYERNWGDDDYDEFE